MDNPDLSAYRDHLARLDTILAANYDALLAGDPRAAEVFGKALDHMRRMHT